MPRIRTIKPEFPQSESMGRVSRDARLLFIELWTICDDSGRTRAASRMLASLLFPYDDDAKDLIEGWLSELEAEGCIVRYVVDGDTYLQVCKWLTHQKIDRPSVSKTPEFDESSRMLASPREKLLRTKDQGPRTKDQGIGEKTLDHRADDRARIDDDFDTRFWPAYPRKVGKENARKAFVKLKPDRETVERMVQAVKVQSASDQWRRDGGQFIPHPATWLHGRRWEDEQAAPRNETPLASGLVL